MLRLQSVVCISSWLLTFTVAQSNQWPIPHEISSETLPVLEVSLDPPSKPFPEISASLGDLEKTREKFEAGRMARLQASINVAVQVAQKRIGEIIGNAMRVFDDPDVVRAILLEGPSRIQKWSSGSFLAVNARAADVDAFTVKAIVHPGDAADSAIKPKLFTLEHARHELEKRMFERAIEDSSGLIDVSLNEFEAQIQTEVKALLGRLGVQHSLMDHAVTSFKEHEVKQLPLQENVRIIPSGIPYPTVQSMVQDMQLRRDVSENLASVRILNMHLTALEALNRFAKSALEGAVKRVMGQYSTILARFKKH